MCRKIAACLIVLCILLAFAPAARCEGRWVRLPVPGRPARITFYGPWYGEGDICASGQAYARNGWFVALGPAMLESARKLSGRDWPLVRLIVPGPWHPILPVCDTGAAGLEVDLPDETWEEIGGLDPVVGVFYGYVEVWTPGELCVSVAEQ